ncbi:MAG: hypothetical protein HY744_23480 [Deltaproteobacteria bacterium]|nr:hypothetical protein [Deltaproteobacteria bacterium]
MSQTLRYRLFGIGAMPPALHAAAEREGPIVLAEGVATTLRRSGRVPGRVVCGEVRALSGALAVTDRRVVGTVGRHKVLDFPFSAAGPGPATVTLGPEGLVFALDLGRAVRGGSGGLTLHWKEPLRAEQLARMPATTLTLPVDEQGALGLFQLLR